MEKTEKAKETPEELRDRLRNYWWWTNPPKTMIVEQIYQLARIAEAMELITAIFFNQCEAEGDQQIKFVERERGHN